MPTENSQIISQNFADIFSGERRYEIPFFQRGYAWQSRQWNALRQDVDEQILETVENGDFAAQEHFFGPVVVSEKTGGIPQVRTFQIIDGQQRITTVYLMLAYIRKQMEKHFCQSPDARDYHQRLGKLLVNNVADTQGDDYWKMKVFSTKGDRLATYYAVFGRDESPQTPMLASDQQLYVPGSGNITALNKWLNRHFGKKSATELWQWVKAITVSLKVVWIPLDEKKDDPQAIFESLNDKGIPLTAAELLCNYLFRPLIDEQNRRHEMLHLNMWLKSHRKFMDNASFEEYLRHLFSIGEPKAIGKGRRVYVHFKTKNRKLAPAEAEKQLENIASSADLYIRIAGSGISFGGPATGLLDKIRDTNMASCRPFLLAILQAKQEESLTKEDANRLMQEVYVLLVRRKMMTDWLSARYDTLFPSLLNKIKDESDKVEAMHQAIKENRLWVSDEDFKDAFLHQAIYRSNELNFTRLILREIDTYMAKETHGELPDYGSIRTVEHIAPQTLTDEWSRELEANTYTHEFVKSKLHTIGNLCLRSSIGNADMGRESFAKKKELLDTSPSLLARDIVGRDGPWNIAAIDKRTKFLAEKALQIWKWGSN